MHACVIGSGPFGTALANNLAVQCDRVWLWGRNATLIEQINTKHENPRYLPGVDLLPNIKGTVSLREALRGAGVVVLAIPSHSLRAVIHDALAYLPVDVPIVITSKAIEGGTLFTMTELLRDCLPLEFHQNIALLSGPSFAAELAKQRPTFVVISAFREDVALRCQRVFQTETLRLQVNLDTAGVQIGGALKNVIAIAVGISDGLNLGYNMKAALITWGLEEISRLAVRVGADPRTLYGLSGIGDLVLTSTGPQSRSWQVGCELAKGHRLDEILVTMNKEMIEGVKTAQSIMGLAAKAGVRLPMCYQVHRVLNGKNALQAMKDLQQEMFRPDLVRAS